MQFMPRKIGEFFLDIIETLVIALSIFLVVYLFFMQPHQVSGQSMVPNFLDKEYVLTDKVSYKLRSPEKGEIIVFHAPEGAHCTEGTGCDFIKRVIGTPGDTVSLQNSTYFVNGEALAEPYIPEDFETLPGDFMKGRTVTLGPGEYFVSGDNRPYSADSRAWGPIIKQDIVGRVFFRYWPLNKLGVIKKANY